MSLAHHSIVFAAKAPSEASAAGASRLKRGFDIVGAAGLLLLFLPLLLLAAFAIRFESRGPVFFRQERTGLGGRVFQVLKFRSMYLSAPGADVRQATRGDPRVTRVGHLIRALSVDELPQLVNVLRGEMSLVGPRPHAVCHDREWARLVPGYDLRFRARPGLTGLAQIRGCRGEINGIGDLQRRIDADRAYIDGWSFRGDLVVLALTVPRVLHDRAAY